MHWWPRRESAGLTGDLESVAGIADFRLIDPPQFPILLSPPIDSAAASWFARRALAAGMAAAFAMSQLRPTFGWTSRTLRK